MVTIRIEISSKEREKYLNNSNYFQKQFLGCTQDSFMKHCTRLPCLTATKEHSPWDLLRDSSHGTRITCPGGGGVEGRHHGCHPWGRGGGACGAIQTQEGLIGACFAAESSGSLSASPQRWAWALLLLPGVWAREHQRAASLM